jgi:hypothetical protein
LVVDLICHKKFTAISQELYHDRKLILSKCGRNKHITSVEMTKIYLYPSFCALLVTDSRYSNNKIHKTFSLAVYDTL